MFINWNDTSISSFKIRIIKVLRTTEAKELKDKFELKEAPVTAIVSVENIGTYVRFELVMPDFSEINVTPTWYFKEEFVKDIKSLSLCARNFNVEVQLRKCVTVKVPSDVTTYYCNRKVAMADTVLFTSRGLELVYNHNLTCLIKVDSHVYLIIIKWLFEVLQKIQK